MFLIGYDIGSSSVKAALVDVESNHVLKVTQYPSVEMDIMAQQPGWAEQDPEIWWENLCLATKDLIKDQNIDASDVKGIGISYQMHGLVLVDESHQSLRPSIIWCDSRAVEIGDKAFQELGADKCYDHLLNSPGNFTASKLKWVADNEPEILAKAHKFMLPGDYIAMKMTGEVSTTIQGLSEGILWDFKDNTAAGFVLDHYGIDQDLIPNYGPAFETPGVLTASAAALLGLKAGIPVAYRGGDQPNNAMSLGVLEPGEIAATGGTSGVVYGVVDQLVGDSMSRVNSFAHVNHTVEQIRVGVLLCINGSGIQYSWVKKQFVPEGVSYNDIEKQMSSMPIGADGLRIMPFGNGAERMLGNKNIGSHVSNLQFNRHTNSHYYRAAVEGIAFSFVYGMKMMQEMGIDVAKLRVGNDNLFQSAVFSNTISSLMNAEIELVETTGAVGAAKAAGIAGGIYSNLNEAFSDMKIVGNYSPQNNGAYQEAYGQWEMDLANIIANYK